MGEVYWGYFMIKIFWLRNRFSSVQEATFKPGGRVDVSKVPLVEDVTIIDLPMISENLISCGGKLPENEIWSKAGFGNRCEDSMED